MASYRIQKRDKIDDTSKYRGLIRVKDKDIILYTERPLILTPVKFTG